MTDLFAEPGFMATAAADVEQIGSAINAAHAAAAGPTSGVIAPAADEVSAAIAKLFGQYGQEYQAVVAQAAVFHSRFTQALAGAGGAYMAAEAAASKALGGSGAAGAAATTTSAAASALTDPTVAIVMGGDGNPIPGPTYIDGVLKWATQGGF